MPRKKALKPQTKGKEEIISIEEFIARRRGEGKNDPVIAAELGVSMTSFSKFVENMEKKESKK